MTSAISPPSRCANAAANGSALFDSSEKSVVTRMRFIWKAGSDDAGDEVAAGLDRRLDDAAVRSFLFVAGMIFMMVVMNRTSRLLFTAK